MLNPKDFAKYFHPQANFRMTDKEVVGTLHEVTPQDAFVIIQALGFEKIGQHWCRKSQIQEITPSAEPETKSEESVNTVEFLDYVDYRLTPSDLDEIYPNINPHKRAKILRDLGFRPISIRRGGKVIQGWGRNSGSRIRVPLYKQEIKIPVFDSNKKYRLTPEELRDLFPGMDCYIRSKLLRQAGFRPISVRRKDGTVIKGWGRDIGVDRSCRQMPELEDSKTYKFNRQELAIMFPGINPIRRSKILRGLGFKPNGLGCWIKKPLK